MKRTEWLKRDFPPIEDNGILPSIIERLCGTPARIEEMVSQVSPGILVKKPDNKWSVKEHIGHLADLEPTGLHPRLKTPMRMIDLANFVAEHDDHHLASIRELY